MSRQCGNPDIATPMLVNTRIWALGYMSGTPSVYTKCWEGRALGCMSVPRPQRVLAALGPRLHRGLGG